MYTSLMLRHNCTLHWNNCTVTEQSRAEQSRGLNASCLQAFISCMIYAKMLPLKQLLTRRCSLRESIISQGSTFSPATHPSQTLLTYFQLSCSSKSSQCVTKSVKKLNDEHDGTTEEDIKFPP